MKDMLIKQFKKEFQYHQEWLRSPNSLVVLDTRLPRFKGFYGNALFEEILNRDEGDLELFPDEYYDEDGVFKREYWDDLGATIVDSVADATEEVLAALRDEFGLEYTIHMLWKYDGISSPGEYNYYNDIINISVVIDRESLNKLLIVPLLTPELNRSFKQFLEEEFTPVPGYIPHYPNTIPEFAPLLNSWKAEDDPLLWYIIMEFLIDIYARDFNSAQSLMENGLLTSQRMWAFNTDSLF